jgi:integrase
MHGMTKILARDSARRCMKSAEWPARDCALWHAALQPGDLIELGGERARYATVSNRKIAVGYGRWLQHLSHLGILDADQPPADRITRERVAEYIGTLRTVNGTRTVLCRLQEIYEMAVVMGPQRDWSWIRRIASSIRAQHVPARPIRTRVVPSDELYRFGIDLMDTASARCSAVKQAQQYRDGLIIALLAARPLRRRNLAMLALSGSLTQTGEGWWVEFDEDQTKTHAPLRVPVPDDLSYRIDAYLNTHRPILLAKHGRWWSPPGDALWISAHGSALTQMAIYDRVTKLTEEHFGHPVNPQLFRHCLATTVAIEDPNHVGIAGPLLGHRCPQTTEKYYNLAQQRTAAERWQDDLLKRRREPHMLDGEVDDDKD